MAMSTRPLAASICGVKLVATPPWRMNVPSWTLRTRSTLGLKVIVRVIVDTREALLIDTGTVYGPPATWKVVPGTVRMTCDGVAVAGPAGVGGVVGLSRGVSGTTTGGIAPVPGAGGTVPTGAPAGGTAPGGCCGAAPGGTVGAAPAGGGPTGGAAGFSGRGAIGVGT